MQQNLVEDFSFSLFFPFPFFFLLPLSTTAPCFSGTFIHLPGFWGDPCPSPGSSWGWVAGCGPAWAGDQPSNSPSSNQYDLPQPEALYVGISNSSTEDLHEAVIEFHSNLCFVPGVTSTPRGSQTSPGKPHHGIPSWKAKDNLSTPRPLPCLFCACCLKGRSLLKWFLQ